MRQWLNIPLEFFPANENEAVNYDDSEWSTNSTLLITVTQEALSDGQQSVPYGLSATINMPVSYQHENNLLLAKITLYNYEEEFSLFRLDYDT